MKLTIKQLIPVANHWNRYIREESQTYVYVPVSALALVQDIGDENFRTGKTTWQYIDTLHIASQDYPEAFEDLSYVNTLFSLTDPTEAE